MVKNSAELIGNVVMVAGGLLIAAGLLFISSLVALKYGLRTWKNLGTIYKIEAMKYWFSRMQENGTHILKVEHDEKLAAKQAAANEATLVAGAQDKQSTN